MHLGDNRRDKQPEKPTAPAPRRILDVDGVGSHGDGSSPAEAGTQRGLPERLRSHLRSTLPLFLLSAPQAQKEITLPHLVASRGQKLRARTWDASWQHGN